ncbi:LysR family transcriptional regulator [Marinobacterium sediminicola]|uniref:Transcriptional regulator, LysR family n=1 Tax=Marinobacterium sediminicola TaxID=518898 RepID=A0ABY1S3Z6_9GAMM|nr:LysR family transcriptional regulator [Marinobacterium sediminicola]ULG70171.1 LysR family transcriptional regulator [Marinobacterium sediminicola]SMR78359.1 transcriptional regulator, LysR family [Marinobacterium sediminicola]
MDKLGEMQVFVAIVRSGGFSSAARELGLSPSAVSKQVTRLEKRLGVRLLHRTTRSVRTTEAGQQFYRRCVKIMADVEDAEDLISDLGQLPKGKLRINSTPGYARHQLMPLLIEFQQLYPGITIELDLTGQTVNLVREQVDLAFRLGELRDTSLVARRLCESPRIVCASPEYLHRYGMPLHPSELANHQCLRLNTSEAFNQWRFRGGDGEYRMDVKGGFITDNVEALHGYALLGGGIARLASFIVDQDLNEGRLVPLLQDYQTDRQQVHLVYAHRKHQPAKLKVFVEFVINRLALSDT